MDMDARIRSGLVFKLRVPDGVRSRLAAILQRPVECAFFLDGHRATTMCLPRTGAARYIIRRFDGRRIDDIVICCTGASMYMGLYRLVKNAWSGNVL